jgi:hypothetical protein
LIGAWKDDTGATDAGAAYLFNTNGSLLTTLTNPVPVNAANFGWTVATVGADLLLIGAPGSNPGRGAAYLFSTGGVLVTTFTNPTPEAKDNFGWSVAALGSDRVAIGDWLDDTSDNNAGAVYLFHTNGLLLTTVPGLEVRGGMGTSLAIVGDGRVLTGAPYVDSGLTETDVGAAYLFDTNGVLLTTLTNPTPVFNELFGNSVGVLGDGRVLIGAPGGRTAGILAGEAYLYSTQGTLLTTFTNPTPASGDNFGWSVTGVAGRWVLVGAPAASVGGGGAGAAYLFHTNGTLLFTFTKDSPLATDYFGHAVTAIGQQRVLISAQGDDTGATNAGAAYLFDLPYPTLSITRDELEITIQWSGDETNLIVQASATVGPSASWSDTTEPVTTIGNTYRISQMATLTNRFYRLQRP